MFNNHESTTTTTTTTTAIIPLTPPTQWSTRRKLFVVSMGLVATFNAVFDASLPTGVASPYLAEHFDDVHVADVQLVLPISLYVVGYVLGPLLWGPLSEMYGRRAVMVPCFASFTIFTLATALAPNWPCFLVFRFVCGTCVSSALAIVGGMYSDIYDDPYTRGKAMAFYLLDTVGGAQIGPIVSGFSITAGWQWPYWIGLIVAVVSLIPMLFLPETYLPVLQQRASKNQKNNDSMDQAVAATTTTTTSIVNPEQEERLEEQQQQQQAAATTTTMDMMKLPTGIRTLTRPLKLLFLEPTCGLICLFLSYVNALCFFFFQAYPVIFQDLYGLSPGMASLAFIPIAFGTVVGLILTLTWDTHFHRASLRGEPWALRPELRRLPLACFVGPLFVVVLLWLGWSSSPSKGISAACPMLAGVPFGIGFFLIFTSLVNYLTDVYTAQAASALAAGSCARSIVGAVLPLAAPKMYGDLGVGWASTVLAGLSLVLSGIPFAYLRWGGRLTPKLV